MEQLNIRDVGNQQVYDSYMGILRISPNIIDGESMDDTTLVFSNPKESNGEDRKIIISDSDGIELGAYFVPRVKKTKVLNQYNELEDAEVINLSFHTNNTLYVSQSLNVRSTLFLNKKSERRISPIQIYTKRLGSNSFDITAYPVESPHDDDYFNNKNKLGLINPNSNIPIRQQLDTKLYEMTRAEYDKIPDEHKVKISGKLIYTTNKYSEKVPILYTRDYAVGSYSGHTAFMNKDTRDFIDENYLSGNTGLVPISDDSKFTRLSFVRLDDIIWKSLEKVLTGKVRSREGRYDHLGENNDENIGPDIFGDADITLTAPLSARSVPSGIVMYNAMPIKRFLFHNLRQILRNAEDERNYRGDNNLNLRREYVQYYNNGSITAIKETDPGFINTLTKEFVLCDGKELTYENYQNINTANDTFFQHDGDELVKRNSNGKPIENTAWQTGPDNTYKAIKDSSYDKKLRTPHLLDIDNLEMRFIRGLNWSSSLGESTPIKNTTNTSDKDNLYNNTYSNNTNIIKINTSKEVNYPEWWPEEKKKPELWGAVKKDFHDVGNYRTNIDFKIHKTPHRHYTFYDSNSFNREAKTNSIATIRYTEWKKKSYGINKKKTRITPSIKRYYRQALWDIDNYISATNDEVEMGERNIITDYSFYKHVTFYDDHNNRNGFYTNSLEGHTIVPAGGLCAFYKGSINDYEKEMIDNQLYEYIDSDGNQVIIKSDNNRRISNSDLIEMNRSESRIPIANKGGTDLAQTNTMAVKCRKKKKRFGSFQYNYWRRWWEAYTGGYNLVNAVDELQSENDDIEIVHGDLDVPRCITSLPAANPNKDIFDKNKDNTKFAHFISHDYQKSLQIKDLPTPPSINLIPLLKI